MDEIKRKSIVEEIAQAFSTNCASVASLQQAFFSRNEAEIAEFCENCTQELVDAITEMGFSLPVPAGLVIAAPAPQTEQAVDPAPQASPAPTPAPAEENAFITLLRFFRVLP